MDVVLIPAYEPEGVLVTLARSLHQAGFSVLVVDDGSGEPYAEVFSRVAQHATVLTHRQNRGKGAALKTGLQYVLYSMPDCAHVITCDADGQHKIEDVARVRDTLHAGQKFVLTMRTPKKDIPFRSKFGNALSRVVYTLLTNRYLSDNQSGLRGYHRDHFEWLVAVDKDNYDYEMNVLYCAAKKNIYIATLPIEAVYIDNNASSHFSPVLDTVRIYRSLFKLASGSLAAFLFAEILVFIASFTLEHQKLYLTLPSIGALSYLVATTLERFVVLKRINQCDYWLTLVYTVITYFVYTLHTALLIYGSLGALPLWLAFNITVVVCLPLRYYLHKFIFIASRTRAE